MRILTRPGPLLAAAGTALLVALVVGIAGSPSPLAAVDVTSPELEAFARDLHDLVPDDQRAALADATESDGAGDQYHPSGEQPGITPPESDIALGASFGVSMTADVLSAETGPGGIANCASAGTACSAIRAGLPTATTFHAYAGTLRAPLRPGAAKRVELGVVAFDETPRDGRPAAAWEEIPEFPGDFFRGSNVAWTLLSQDGRAFQLFRLEYGPGDAGFLAAKTDAIGIVRGSAWAILVPSTEWEGTVNDRLFVFLADGDDFGPERSVVDTYPDIFDPARSSVGRPTIALATVSPRGPSVSLLVAGGVILLVVAFGGWFVLSRRRGRAAS